MQQAMAENPDLCQTVGLDGTELEKLKTYKEEQQQQTQQEEEEKTIEIEMTK